MNAKKRTDTSQSTHASYPRDRRGTKQVAKAIREVPKTITETTGKAAGASKVNEFKDKTNLK